MTQVGLDLEFGAIAVHEAVAQVAAELLGHDIVGQIGDVADHARDLETAYRHHAVTVIVPAMKIRIGDDGLARHLVEGDVLRGQARSGGDDKCVGDALRIGDGPLQGLHRSQRTTHHRCESPDSQMIGQACLGVDPILHRDHREVGAIGLVCRRVQVLRAGRAETATEVVDSDDEEPVGVEWLAGSHHVVPPADIVGVVLIKAGDMMRGIERVAHQHGVTAIGVEAAIGLIGKLEMRYRPAAAECERLGELRHLRLHDTDRTRIQDHCLHKQKTRATGRLFGSGSSYRESPDTSLAGFL